jgi:hypothetical protein
MRFLLSAAFLLCASVAVRLSWAEGVFRADSTSQALRLLGSSPNAAYWERLADLEPADSQEVLHLRQALQANPRLTSARIRLGLLEEQRGDFGSAEHTLLEAAQYDRQYLPAWTLANYYFRRQRQSDFWQWSRAALALNTGDPIPLLRLASLVADGDDLDEAAVLDHLQGGDQIAYPYLELLIRAGRLRAAQRIARVVLRSQTIQRDRLMDLSTRQLKAGHVGWALEIWNAIHSPLDPERGPALADAVFEKPDGEGFHLRPESNVGISADWRPEETIFSFDGVEPDACPLFEQPIPAPQRGMRYRLRSEYKSSATGVRWRMAGWESPSLLPRQDWGRAEWIISVAPGPAQDSFRILPLQLFYQREPGTTPARGELSLRNLQLTIL